MSVHPPSFAETLLEIGPTAFSGVPLSPPRRGVSSELGALSLCAGVVPSRPLILLHTATLNQSCGMSFRSWKNNERKSGRVRPQRGRSCFPVAHGSFPA